MFWIRRIFAVLLAIGLIIILPLLLFVSRIDGTVGNPGFYNDQMEKADVYNFVYDTALPAALDEVESEDSEDNLLDTDNIEEAIVKAARQIAPPQWLQENFENLTREIVPYLTGETDEFSYSIEFKDKVKAAPAVIKEEILRGEAMGYIYDDLVSYAGQKVADNSDRLPYSLELDEDEVAASLKSVVSRQWIALRIEETLNAVIPYMILDSDAFVITVPVEERLEDLGQATFELLDREETYDYIVEEIVAPIVRQELEPEVELSFNVTLTHQEVIDGIEKSLPRDWFRDRLQEQISSIISYARGESDDTTITVDIAERKPAILDTLVELGDRKLEEIFNQLPRCSRAEFNIAKNNTPPGQLPYCRPVGVGFEEYKEMLDIDLSSQINDQIMKVIPDQWIYTQDDLIDSMGGENEDFLDEVRMHVENGWIFTETDLKSKLGDPEDIDRLEDIRNWMGNGYTFTQQDLEDEMDEDELENFDDWRSFINSISRRLWVLWLIPVLLLIAIGYLGGHNWRTRSIWALTAMLLASVIAFITVSLTYSGVVKSEMEDLIDTADLEGLELVMAEKMNEMFEIAAGDFAGGMQNDALSMIVFAGIALLGVAGWTLYQRRYRT